MTVRWQRWRLKNIRVPSLVADAFTALHNLTSLEIVKLNAHRQKFARCAFFRFGFFRHKKPALLMRVVLVIVCALAFAGAFCWLNF